MISSSVLRVLLVCVLAQLVWISEVNAEGCPECSSLQQRVDDSAQHCFNLSARVGCGGECAKELERCQAQRDELARCRKECANQGLSGLPPAFSEADCPDCKTQRRWLEKNQGACNHNYYRMDCGEECKRWREACRRVQGEADACPRACAAKPCQAYAEAANAAHRENQKLSCGLAGPAWQDHFDNHNGWCVGASPKAREVEARRRNDALAECRKRKGLGESAGDGCDHARTIERLRREISQSRPGAAQVRARQLRVEFIETRHEFERLSRFTMTADQDFGATLKFDTPEEELLGLIETLLSLVGKAEAKVASGASSMFRSKREAELAQRSLDRLNNALSNTKSWNARRTKKKAKFDEILAEYKRLTKLRGETLANLSTAALASSCHVLTEPEAEAIRLYHEGVQNNPQCNELERQALSERIERLSTGPHFGELLERRSYERATKECRLGIRKSQP